MAIPIIRKVNGAAMDEILTVQEVADYLKISRSTIWRWCNEGTLPAFKIGRGWRIRRHVVEGLTDEQARLRIFEKHEKVDNAHALFL